MAILLIAYVRLSRTERANRGKKFVGERLTLLLTDTMNGEETGPIRWLESSHVAQRGIAEDHKGRDLEVLGLPATHSAQLVE